MKIGWLVYGLLVLGAACGEVAEPPARAFIAVRSSFQDFGDWPTFEANPGAAEPHRVHINRLAPPESTRFPMGTIIVKSEETTPNRVDWHVYAMVKRGPEFNLQGALGWEWFELKAGEAQGWEIMWRAAVPPSGATYRCVEELAGNNAPDCNACHMQARRNDFVLTEALQL